MDDNHIYHEIKHLRNEQRQRDWTLEALAGSASAGNLRMGVSLLVGGQWISGMLTSPMLWGESLDLALGEATKTSPDEEPPAAGFTRAMRERLEDQEAATEELVANMGKPLSDELLERKSRLTCEEDVLTLEDATLDALGARVHAPLVRVMQSSVVAWLPGLMQAGPSQDV